MIIIVCQYQRAIFVRETCHHSRRDTTCSIFRWQSISGQRLWLSIYLCTGSGITLLMMFGRWLTHFRSRAICHSWISQFHQIVSRGFQHFARSQVSITCHQNHYTLNQLSQKPILGVNHLTGLGIGPQISYSCSHHSGSTIASWSGRDFSSSWVISQAQGTQYKDKWTCSWWGGLSRWPISICGSGWPS